MRVVEPSRYDHTQKVRKRPHKALFFGAIVVMVSVGVFAGWKLFIANDSTQQPVVVQQPEPTEEEAHNTVEQAVPVVEEPTIDPVVALPPVTSLALRMFADNEFKIFYDQLLQPGLEPVENPPEIYGDVIADARIQTIAEDRGYRLRSSPNVALSSVDGYPVQSQVVQPWLDLKAAAAAEGLQMSVVSGFRAVSNQRGLFTSRLAATGATVTQVAAGTADALVDEILITSSIPGYSKHHTGYTIDILCAGYAFESFKDSPCNTWITANNYEKAKTYGFIPSYPPGADLQGPDPEAWEYVWVGAELLKAN